MMVILTTDRRKRRIAIIISSSSSSSSSPSSSPVIGTSSEHCVGMQLTAPRGLGVFVVPGRAVDGFAVQQPPFGHSCR
eukprot:1599910-Rhodomonas_salina.1